MCHLMSANDITSGYIVYGITSCFCIRLRLAKIYFFHSVRWRFMVVACRDDTVTCHHWMCTLHWTELDSETTAKQRAALSIVTIFLFVCQINNSKLQISQRPTVEAKKPLLQKKKKKDRYQDEQICWTFGFVKKSH